LTLASKIIDFKKKVLYGTFFVFSGLFSLQADTSPPPSANSLLCPTLSSFNANQINKSKIQWHVDGDTVHTVDGQKLRLLNINAPELNPTNKRPPQRNAHQALKLLKQIAPLNESVYWVYDEQKTDRYSRQLVYLFNKDGEFVNAKMIASGLAHQLVIPPNQRFWRCLQQLEKKAKKQKLGVWSEPSQVKRSKAEIEAANGFHWVSGEIVQQRPSRKYLWLVLDNDLWVGIKRNHLASFKPFLKQLEVGSKLSIKGYLFKSHGQTRVNLNHPAMLLLP
jgi:endonuclease YncB( thermonuclease family)